jgi:hypothetical protein
MSPDNPLWLAPTVAAIALAALAWMTRAYLGEWRAYRAGTLLPRDYTRRMRKRWEAAEG